jgi:hypothetical protein
MEGRKMRILMIGTPYPSFECCTVVDGLQWLGHTVYGFNGDANNYVEPHKGEEVDIVMHCYPQVGDINAFSDKPKAVVWGADRWLYYDKIPDSPVVRMPTDKFIFDVCFYRDLDVTIALETVHPFSFGIERRYIEACEPHLNGVRQNQIVFYGTLSTAKREHFLGRLRESGVPVESENYKFTTPDTKWSKWINSRYKHVPAYYEALCKNMFVYCGFGAGPSCGRTYEAYAAGCIPVIQKFPDDVISFHDFKHAENCILWSDEKELINNMRYYIEHTDEAEELRQKCYQYGQENLLTKHVAQYMLDKIEEI